MVKRLVVAGFLVSMVLVSSASAFDGLRKGFVLGGGLGLAPTASWDADIIDDSGTGFGLNLLIGYAWDEYNMIVYEGNIAGYKSIADIRVSQGFNGASWYHYFGPQGKSFFTTAGLGFYVFDFDHDSYGSGSNDPGAGVLLGGGYLSFGRTSDSFYDYNHTHISVLVSAVAF